MTADAAPATAATPAEPTPDAPADQATPPDQPAAPEGAPDEAHPSREAAGYRVKLRAAEAERDTLAGRVQSLQRAEAERLAADTLAAPADLWAVGAVDLAGLLTDAGDLDPEAVKAAAAALLAARPGLARPVPRRLPNLGQGVRESTPAGSDWSDLLRGGK